RRCSDVHSNYTHVYVSSGNVISYYAEAFDMTPAKIYPYGIPRIDLFNKNQEMEIIKSTITNKYPLLGKKNNITVLVAPTYRAGGNYGESSFDFIKQLLNVISLINKNIMIIFKAHPYTNQTDLNTLKNSSNVIIGDDYNINKWMLVSDAFVTDYSSAIFEYALLKKPLAHFVPDLEEYSSNRGFYAEIKDVSDGTILMNE